MSVLRPISFLGSRQPRGGLFIFIIFLVGLALGGAGGFHLKGYLNQTLEGQPGAPAQVAPGSPVPPPLPAGPTAQGGAVPGAVPAPAALPGAPAAPSSPEWKTIDAPVTGSLAETMDKNVDGRLADVLNAELGRVLVWWIDLTKDVLKNDRLQLVYKPSDNPTERHVTALRYTSRKNAKTYAAYLYKPEKAQYPRFYDENGQEVERRLLKSPVEQYEQITTVLAMTGRRHHGIDFKTDVGTLGTLPPGMPAGLVAGDPGTGKLMHCLRAAACSSISTHDGEWVTFEGDLLPEMLRGLQASWERGFLKDSRDLTDYRPAGICVGWEVPGVFDVAVQIRGLSLRATTR